MIKNNAPALAPLIFLFAGIIIPLVALKLRSLAYYVALAATFAATIVSLFNVFSVLETGPIRYYFGGWVIKMPPSSDIMIRLSGELAETESLTIAKLEDTKAKLENLLTK